MALIEIKKHIFTDNVLDLYAGVGTIGLSVAHDKNLTLVEIDKSAFRELCKNCEPRKALSRSINGDGPFTERPRPVTLAPWDANCQRQTGPRERSEKDAFLAILAKSENVLNYVQNDQTVILDPPRAGCDKKLIDRLLEIIPEKIIYLSCNPATQVRDVKYLLEKYSLKLVKAFNFFPHTPHIENLVILERKNG